MPQTKTRKPGSSPFCLPILSEIFLFLQLELTSTKVSLDYQASCSNSLFLPSYPIPVPPSGKGLLFLGR